MKSSLLIYKLHQKTIYFINKSLQLGIIKKIITSFLPNNNNILFIRYIFGSLTIVGNNKTYKIAVLKNSLNTDLKNRKIISAEFIKFEKHIAPTKIYTKCCFLIYESETLFNIIDKDKLLLGVSIIIATFNSYAYMVEKTVLADLPYIQNGLLLLRKFLSDTEYKKLIFATEIAISKEKYFRPSHGDFHQKNMLMDQDSNYYIIDFDCFRESNFIWMDELYFYMEFILNNDINTNQSWLYLIQILLDNSFNELKPLEVNFININLNNVNNILLLYFLDRLAQESNYVKNLEEILDKMIIKNILNKLTIQVEA